MDPANPGDHEARGDLLLRRGRYMTLATTDGETPWAATVNFVPFGSPPRLVYYSLRDCLHSRNIAARPEVAGSIYLLGTPGFGLDGAQFTGRCRQVPDAEVPAVRTRYYELNFPDPAVRSEWLLPEAEFTGTGPRRFYTVRIDRWWLLDIERWLIDKHDQRVEADLPVLDPP